jgi:hypothetical protein
MSDTQNNSLPIRTKGTDARHWLLSLRGDAIVQASVANVYDDLKADIHQKTEDVQFIIHRSFFRAQQADFFETIPIPSSDGRASLGTRDEPYVLSGVTPLDFSRFLAVFSTP